MFQFSGPRVLLFTLVCGRAAKLCASVGVLESGREREREKGCSSEKNLNYVVISVELASVTGFYETRVLLVVLFRLPKTETVTKRC